MSTWVRVTLTAILWTGGLALHALLAAPLGAGVVAVSVLVVAVTAWLWGALAGLAFGLLVGVAAEGLLAAGAPRRPLLDLVREGDLAAPFVLAVVGAAFGAAGTLRRQVRVHRDASDRAQYDVLTGALNRQTFERRIQEWMEAGANERTAMFAVLFVDLDRFKFVNDTYGHDVGDRLLQHIARTLRDNVREGDLVARVGGDEFVIALRGLRDRETAAVIAEKLVKMLSTPYDIDGRSVTVSASIGIALYPRDGEDVATLTKSADFAMYVVKAAGKNAYNFSTLEMRNNQSRRLDLERQLRFAMHDDELEMVYQPQVDLKDGRLVGFEALLRWNNRELGLVPPAEFIPIAEEAGMIVPIGHWLLREACFQMRSWQSHGYGPLKIAVNVSTLQFRQPEFLGQVASAIADSRIEPWMLEIEITESVLIEQFELAVATIRKLDRLGVRTALDDFGTGYSSLAYLQRLPIGTLKIDRSFVSALSISPTGQAGSAVPIVEAMAALGRKLGKTMVAEGVETDAQARYLAQIGIDRAQGYLFSRPMTPPQSETLLKRVAADALREGARAPQERPRSPTPDPVMLLPE